MTIEKKPFARFRNDSQGLSFQFPAHWSCATKKSNDDSWASVDDGPLANLKITLFAIDEFFSKWNFNPRDPIAALNPYLVYRSSQNSEIHEILDGSAINGQSAFSSIYRERDVWSEAGKRKTAVIHDNQIAIIEAEWETNEHQTWVTKIVDSLKIAAPLPEPQSCSLKIRHFVIVNKGLQIHELTMPYTLSWSFEYHHAFFQQISRFKMNSGRFYFHYFLDSEPGYKRSQIMKDDHIEIERKAVGLIDMPEWDLVQTESKIVSVNGFEGGAEAIVGTEEQMLYLLTDINHAGFIRDLVGDVELNTKPAPLDKVANATCLESILIQPDQTHTDLSNGRWKRHYYSLAVDNKEMTANGIDTITAVFMARNAQWRSLENKKVTIETEPPVDIQQNRSHTGADGQILATLKSDKVTDVTIIAIDKVHQPIAKTVVHFKPPPHKFELSVDRKEVWADGEDLVQVLVTVQDAQGQPVQGQKIHIQVSPKIDITQSDFQTNEDGEVRGSFACSAARSFNVFAVDGLKMQITRQQTITGRSTDRSSKFRDNN